MPLQSTSGAASYDAFGGGAAAKVNYIEDFFQSYLRTGTGASATVTTGLDGSTKETLVWTKSRSAATNHKLTDNVRGATKALSSNTTDAEATDSQGLTAFSATGYTIGTNTDYNNSGATYVDWQWVSQPKFFDVVTYTGNGTASQVINHNLGSVPGCIITKSTSNTRAWWTYHRSTSDGVMALNSTAAKDTAYAYAYFGNNTVLVSPTSTQFTIGFDSGMNTASETYVAYLFAHDAGGFGLTGTDNVISCGSYSGTGSVPNDITLGFEPQWLLVKNTTSSGQEWGMFDNMRGLVTGTDGDAQLFANASSAENISAYFRATATGFACEDASTRYNNSGNTYIYIAIRRGPMKVPTSGTSVYETGTQLSTSPSFVSGFPVDFAMRKYTGISDGWNQVTRLQGPATLGSDSTAAETTGVTSFTFDYQTGWSTINSADSGIRSWMFRRAPSFMDVVCYTGTGSATTFAHNLATVPELMIVKDRTAASSWRVYSQATGNGNCLFLQGTQASTADSTVWNNTSPTSSVFTVGTGSAVNEPSDKFVAYLFATCAGVSKCTSFTGTGTLQTIDCGFTAGSRFVLIKRTDSTGDWYVWDSSRGLSSSTDPYLLLNSTAAEVTSTNWVDTTSTGFQVTAASGNNVNINGASYIALAIA